MKQRTKKNGNHIDDWETPEFIKQYVINTYGEYFDPCPLHSSFDGLTIDWKSVNYINPPYSRTLKEKFILKALQESKKGSICVMLIPANTDTKIFHETIVPNSVVKLIKKRVSFKGYNVKGEYIENGTGQSGSMLVIFGTNEKPNISTITHEQMKGEQE